MMKMPRDNCLAIGVLGAAAVSMAGYVANAAVDMPATSADTSPGQAVFNAQCISCHGIDAGGLEGLGVSLVDSDLVSSSSEEELFEFLKVGRMPTDPATITGLIMPGFAWMAEDDLAGLAQYLQSIAE